MPDNDKIIERYLNTLITGIGDVGAETQQLKEEIGNLRREYEEGREAAKSGTPEQKSAFALYQTALANGLPGITKGTLAAVTAFRQQPPDAIAGSAAVMDICSSLVSALSGLSTAGGPPGAVLGALFSMISMLLNFFAPKPPDLLEQIEKLMRDLGAEEKKSEVGAAGDAVKVYAEVCDRFMKPPEGGGVQDPDLLAEELNKVNLVEGNIVTTIRKVRNWLLEAGNQDLDGWPEILNLHCEVYMHLMLAVTKQNLYAHDTKRIKKYVGDPTPDPAKSQKWAKLQRRVKVKFENLQVNNTQTAGFLKKVVPVARKRGVFVIAYSGGNVHVASGPKAFQENRFGKTLFGHCRKMSITRPREGVNSPSAQYDIWVLDSGSGKYSYYSRLDTKKLALTFDAYYVGPENSTVGKLFLDWWPVSGGGNTFTVYGARDYKQGGAVEAYTWNKDAPKKFDRINWRPVTGPKMVQIRIAMPLAILPDDPDKDEMPEDLLKNDSIIYGTLEGSKDIFVFQGNMQADVRIPMSSYSGIAVDRYFLWMYGKDGFACATHASVMSCINKKRSMPNWLGPPANNIARVRDLSSCEDGTLLVSGLDPDRLSTGGLSRRF